MAIVDLVLDVQYPLVASVSLVRRVHLEGAANPCARYQHMAVTAFDKCQASNTLLIVCLSAPLLLGPKRLQVHARVTTCWQYSKEVIPPTLPLQRTQELCLSRLWIFLE